MSSPNYWAASGLVVDIVGVVLLANDLFKGHVREWIDDRHATHVRALERICADVVAQYRALPRTVYSEQAIEELASKAEAHYEKLKADSSVELTQKLAAHSAGVRTNQWRGVWLISIGFVLQLVGSL